jgi:hypothetical protein
MESTCTLKSRMSLKGFIMNMECFIRRKIIEHLWWDDTQKIKVDIWGSGGVTAPYLQIENKRVFVINADFLFG